MAGHEAHLARLAEYVDGTLPDEAARALEQQLAEDSSLREALAHLEQIDSTLRGRFTPNAPFSAADILAFAGVSNAHASSPAGTRPPDSSSFQIWLRRMGVAAAVAAGCFGAWAIWQEIRPDPTRSMIQGPPPLKTASAYFNNEVASGFEPDWVCSDDEQFEATFRDRFGQALRLTEDPTGRARMLGIDYAPVLSPMTLGVLGESEGKDVMVLIDLLERDDPDSIYIDCANLRVHRREIGTLVLYELSALPDARLLDLFEPAS